jgi:hypothetical protein
MKREKRIVTITVLAFLALAVTTILIVRIFQEDKNVPVKCAFDFSTGDVAMDLDETCRLDRIDFEYGYFPEPQFSDATHEIRFNAYDIPYHKSEFISVWISPTESSSKMHTHVVYEVLWQSEEELYIMRCEKIAGEIYNSDIYNLTTKEIVSQ